MLKNYLLGGAIHYDDTNEITIVVSFIPGSGVSCGKIIQRFPAKDWPDCPFTEAIELVRLFKLLGFKSVTVNLHKW